MITTLNGEVFSSEWSGTKGKGITSIPLLVSLGLATNPLLHSESKVGEEPHFGAKIEGKLGLRANVSVHIYHQ